MRYSRVRPVVCSRSKCKSFGYGPFFEVEEDAVEAKEQERDRKHHEEEGSVAEGVLVPEDVDIEPFFWLADVVFGIGPCDEDCQSRCAADDDCDEDDCEVEAVLVDEESQHDRVDEAGNAGTGGDDSNGEALLRFEPCCDD